MLEQDEKKEGISLGIYQFWHIKMIYKNGRTVLATDKDGLLKLYSLVYRGDLVSIFIQLD